MKTKTSLGHAAAIISIVVWGTTFISTKVLLRGLTPIEILFLRFVAGFVALCLLQPKPCLLYTSDAADD